MNAINLVKKSGNLEPFNEQKLNRCISWMCAGLNVDSQVLSKKLSTILKDGLTTNALNNYLTVESASLISKTSPDWTYVAARSLLLRLYKHVTGGNINYPTLQSYLQVAHKADRLSDYMVDAEQYDHDVLNAEIVKHISNDLTFDYLSLQTLEDRYLLRNDEGTIIELPQHLLMRVAMGIASVETSKEARTQRSLDYYRLYTSKRFLNSTATLFNSGTRWPQLSSCFGNSLQDSTEGIMDGLYEVAVYSKYSGGVATDFTNLRERKASINSTKGEAGGLLPYLKLLNGVGVGWDQSGKRKASLAAYCEPWHPDFLDFLDLREPGDERLRAHDIFPAVWVNDLLMKRVESKGNWSFFSPKTYPELHTLYGEEFERRYIQLENEGKFVKQIPANVLWERVLSRLSVHGVNWPCFKDTTNYRYTQVQSGSVLSSNLCTEITLRSGEKTTFVCNLGSVNVSSKEHLLIKKNGKYLWNSELEKTVRIAVRNLDSVISVGYIPHANGAASQSSDRPIGLGVCGWASALYAMGIDFESAEHIEYCHEVMRQIAITAIDASSNLSKELGNYPTFGESMWAKGILPLDTLRHHKVVEKFNLDLSMDNCPFTSYDELRTKVSQGMRNSNLLAIAPTATLSNILGVTPCTELSWQEETPKKNLSGVFNWFSPTIGNNPFNLPQKTFFSINPAWVIYAAAARQIWIDQSQSTNIPVPVFENQEKVGQFLKFIYNLAWVCGLKTTYYLQSNSRQSKLKDTLADVSFEEFNKSNEPHQDSQEYKQATFCSLADPNCEACQ